ncbi:hypothetical protein KNP414_00357 [Paenibacillus mucilaginosus KNP414]|uniref:Uncharacterized protein n=1 Tax=Paenibacillus mucilaginosus (strain KNP414) TaxID=1036673 RepID=F8FNE5_PAEMK|nr:hypothetical protein KNP414_00357 [Paenibacillus mucilaginosus KNP414]
MRQGRSNPFLSVQVSLGLLLMFKELTAALKQGRKIQLY